MQLHADLGRPAPSRYAITFGGLRRTVAGVLGVLAGVVAYVAGAVPVSARLHLDGAAAYWMAAGVLCFILAAVGWGKYLTGRRFGNWSERAITLYVLAIGLAMFGFGIWRQIAFDAARRRCVDALAAGEDVHARTRVYRSTERLPTLDSGSTPRTITCERLLHS